MKAPVSLCLIVKNEPLLEGCLQSFRDYVEEIVVVDTGSTDETTREVAQKYADKFEIFTECNDPETGLIDDFSQARQRSFDLATQPWIIWADADDLVVGADKLDKLIPKFQSSINGYDGLSIIFPYEYSYDEFGICTCHHYRERLFLNIKCFKWTNPVHEVVIPRDGSNVLHITSDDITYKHQRQYSNKKVEPNRNLRILKKYVEQIGESDARQFYYIGLEYCNAGMIDESIKYLTRYVSLSGWEDEVVMACLKLVDIYQALGQYDEGLKWAFKSIEKKEAWGEGYFALARMFYFLANNGGPNEKRNWEKCAYFARIGLSLPPTKTLLFINPLDRDLEIHRYLNMALNKIGDIKGALNSVNFGLAKRPTDDALLGNKKIYESWLAKQQFVEPLNKLKEIGELNQATLDLITGLINNQIPSAAVIVKNNNSQLILDPQNPFPIPQVSDNANVWSIPNAYNFEDYPLQLSDDQLQATIIMIWKQYMLHDEVLSAISFLENAPYRVRYTVATEKSLSLTKSCLDWMDSEETFENVNSPGTVGEAGTPLPLELKRSAEGHRFDFIVSRLFPNSNVVDFGSMDGGYTNRYGLLGHKAIGLDGCHHSVEIAKRKALEFNTGTEFIQTYFNESVGKVPSNHFDYATSTDTYEHLKDPVEEMLLPAKQMLKSDGKFLLATPHGAWMRGKYIPFAHPWLWEKEGKNWLQKSPRAHLVAPTVWSVNKHFKEAGYFVKDCFVDLCDSSFRDVEGQGNVFVEAHLTSQQKDNALDIVFFIGNGVEEWTPQTIKKTGMGGSETMAYHQAKNLVALGHKVRVYSGVGEWGEGIYDSVEYYKTEKYQNLNCDVLIVSRYADKLADLYNITAKLKLLWVHDVYAINATNELLLKADRILSLTQWHKNFLITKHNIHPDQVVVTRNGIDLSRFDKDIIKNKFKCVNSSSPDRSWAILLEVWPQIKSQVPEAELHLYYGFKNWSYSAQFHPGQAELIARLEQHISELSSLGVVYHDRVSQEKLSEEFLSAGAWIHPTWFTETSCITAMEAQAAGLRMITSSIGALNETVSDRGDLIPGDWTSQEYKNQFVNLVIKALQKENNYDRLQLRQYAIENFGLEKLAQEWNDMFYDLLETIKTNPIVSYQPTRSY